MREAIDELANAIRERKAILFVGAGVSAVLGLPTFQALIGEIGTKLDYDPEVFRLLGDNYTLAEFYALSRGGLGELRSWMDQQWHRDGIDVADSPVHMNIVNLDFPIIYTTNWDSWLERAYEKRSKKVAKIVSVADLATADVRATQIVKFHGDFTDDSSLVLTESSYFDRLSFEGALDIRLRSDALGKSILFIGYSMTDVNMRLLFHKLQQLWDASELSSVRPKSYLLLAGPNEPQETVLRARGITPLIAEDDDPENGLSRFLSKLLARVKGET